MNQDKIGGRIWSNIIIIGLIGQMAWIIVNMYLNLFMFKTISGNPNHIATLVAATSVITFIAALFMGALSDKIGKRKLFIAWGYVLWGFSTMCFALVTRENIGSIFPNASDIPLLTVIALIVVSCIMVFFGATSNDMGYNAWVTDIVEEKNRGKAEGIIAALPLLAVLLVFGGLDFLVNDDANANWTLFFIIVGALVTACGIFAVIFMKDSPTLTKSKSNYWSNITHGFRPSVVKEHKALYITFITFCIFSMSTNVYMPYLIIYIEKFLGFENYALLLGSIILFAALISAVIGRLVDKYGKRIFFFPVIGIYMLGLFLMIFMRSMAGVGIGGIVLMVGSLSISLLVSADLRDKTPKAQIGMFQGIKMIFFVLIPMVIGPFIGAAVIGNSETLYLNSFDEWVPLPNQNIFLAAAVISVLILIPAWFMYKNLPPSTNNNGGIDI